MFLAHAAGPAVSRHERTISTRSHSNAPPERDFSQALKRGQSAPWNEPTGGSSIEGDGPMERDVDKFGEAPIYMMCLRSSPPNEDDRDNIMGLPKLQLPFSHMYYSPY
jgi:hypothetical protein